MRFTGKVWRFGNDVDTDVIIPARYLNTHDPEELARHCLEDLDPTFKDRAQPGDILVAGRNFGCGSSREHAPIAIKAFGIPCVVAASFARIFYRNAINLGLPIIESPEAVEAIGQGDEITVDTSEGTIVHLKTGHAFGIPEYPKFMSDIISSGGLVGYVCDRLKNRGGVLPNGAVDIP